MGNNLRILSPLLLWGLLALNASAQAVDSLTTEQLSDVTVSARRTGTTRMAGAVNGFQMNQDELFRAACCNLGESFVNNPSVDVNYSDATTGAKQIRLLGLSGTYVQMLTENLPNFRGAAAPYALDYVPGPWMKSIQVSKGASSVRNGYESITGQIDVEYLKPEDEQGLTVNVYGDTEARLETNVDANVHLNPRLNTELLLHYQDSWSHHDINHDGFLDRPNVEQYNVQNRWDYLGRTYIFHGGIGFIHENRVGGQTHLAADNAMQALMNHPYTIDLTTDRYEAYMKHAFVLDRDHGTNIAFMASGSVHRLDALYGHKVYGDDAKNGYAQLLYETHFTDQHELSAGLSLNHDYIDKVAETTPGAYAQYTFTPDSRLTAMAGLRLDHSSVYGTFFTPRLHVKYMPFSYLSFRFSAGKGYRTPHALAENTYLLGSGRTLVIDALQQESAWNYGASAALTLPVGDRVLRVNAEYYYTRFCQQAVIDYDEHPDYIHVHDLHGRSFSHTFQADITYPAFDGFTLTAAYRLNDVKVTLGGRLREKPLTNRYKALLTASYKTPLELWQFDATLQVNGGGRIPTSPDYPSAISSRFHAYPQLSAQVTRWFRHFSVYIGGENLTGYRQRTPIIGADNPWSPAFEPTLIWGPVHGAMGYAGIRVNIGKL